MKKVLAIEEEDSLFKAYKEMLEPKGVTVIGAGTGQAGLSMAHSEKPDLIILDVMLPGHMNGFDVLEALERDPVTRIIPVIMLTNLDSEEKVAKKIGAKNYLVKADTSKDEIIKLVMGYLQ
jgi:DNA-binding response OmpR family regulator